LKPEFGIKKIIQMLDAEIAGNPRAIDDHRHGHLIELFPAHSFLENFPLFWSQNLTSSSFGGLRKADKLCLTGTPKGYESESPGGYESDGLSPKSPILFEHTTRHGVQAMIFFDSPTR